MEAGSIFNPCPECGESMAWYMRYFKTASGINPDFYEQCSVHGEQKSEVREG